MQQTHIKVLTNCSYKCAYDDTTVVHSTAPQRYSGNLSSYPPVICHS